ncbi:MAG: hypothetical protein AAFV25_19070, partial [Bacteroidota bacterium]
MDLKQAKIILEKINRLYQSMTLDEDSIDVFEQDLMLSYIRQLYGAFSDEDASANAIQSSAAKPSAVPPLPKVPKVTSKAKEPRMRPLPPTPPPPAPEPVLETLEEVEESIPVEVPEEVVRPVTPEPPRPQVVQKVPEPPKPQTVQKAPEPPKPAPVQKVPEPPKPEPVQKAPEVAKPEVVRPPVQEPVRPAASSMPSSEADALFEHKEATELSEKLAQKPIKDLNKAFGINDRILTIKELFSGDNGAFNETINVLNELDNFDQARAYLTQKVA